jgi:hypothetical protein
VSLITSLVLFTLVVLPLPASAWNIPGHMLSGAIAYQVLRQENPPTIEKVKAVLERHPWYANQWQSRLQDLPVADNDLMLFMQAARWPDDIRIQDKAQNRPSWHYINLPFKPEGQPDSVQAREPEPVNILTALAENERVVKNENDAAKKAIALAWLFHLVGDIHLMLFMQAARWPDDIRIQDLVGESFKKLDLHRGEGAYLDATCDQCTDEVPLLTKGNE